MGFVSTVTERDGTCRRMAALGCDPMVDKSRAEDSLLSTDSKFADGTGQFFVGRFMVGVSSTQYTVADSVFVLCR